MADTDGDNVIAILTHPEVIPTFMVPDLPTREDAFKLFDRIRQLSLAEDRFVYGIYLADTLIGFINDVDRTETEIELGYVIHPDYKNRGYASEALSASIPALFARGYSTVKAGAFEDNAASIRVMEKCGMTLLPHTEETEYRGRTHRCVLYEIRNR
jgi:RimJ/RimL family protein N-acetyltransferase